MEYFRSAGRYIYGEKSYINYSNISSMEQDENMIAYLDSNGLLLIDDGSTEDCADISSGRSVLLSEDEWSDEELIRIHRAQKNV